MNSVDKKSFGAGEGIKRVVLLLIFGMTGETALAQTVYTNRSAYDLQVAVPKGMNVCRESPPASDHGFTVLPAEQKCGDPTANSSITFFAVHNLGDGDFGESVKDTRELAAKECLNNPVSKYKDAIDNHHAYYCVERMGDGTSLMKMFVMLENQKLEISQNISITVQYPDSKRVQVLGDFEKVLRGVKFIPTQEEPTAQKKLFMAPNS